MLNSVPDPPGYRQYAGDELLMLKRRAFITLLGGAAAAWSRAARAQQPATPVIGVLSDSVAGAASLSPAFRQGLKDIGYVEGQNVAIEYRWAENQRDRLPALAADLVGRRVSVIFAGGSAAAQAAKAASSTIPIVFATGGDPVALGLVASLARPGGNVTGVSSLTTTTAAIRLQMLHEAVPSAAVIGALIDPSSTSAEPRTRETQEAARAMGLQLHVLTVSTDRELDAAFATMIQRHVGALIINGSSFFGDRTEQIAALALRHAIPAITDNREFGVAGGLMTYGGTGTEADRLAGGYVGRILKGDKPADLPVQQATRVELVINLKTAKALGIAFPLTLLGRADEVIE
jgi:putative tryptophan/tyrosine transport system substrate-binding protein